jgi:hypothetical protein
MAGLAATEIRRPALPPRRSRVTAPGLLRRLLDAHRERQLQEQRQELERRARWADEARNAPSLESSMGSFYR